MKGATLSSVQSASQKSLENSRLSTGTIGTASIVFFVVAAAAPLAATLGARPVVVIFAGASAPVMYLIAALALLLFAVGFAAMSKYVTNSGGFAAFVSWGLGRWAGYAAAGIALLAYLGMFLGISGQFATFTSDFFSRFFGVEVPWQLVLLIGVVVIGFLAYRDIRISTVVLGIVLILEVIFLLVFDFAVLLQGGATGVNFDSFSPSAVFSPTMGLALLFAFACFVGFESTILYGEEAKSPKTTVPRATYIAVLVIGGVYTFTIWALVLAYGTQNAQEIAAEDPVGFVLNAVSEYLGGWAAATMEILVALSLIAVLLAFHNALNRYVFSLGRANFLPSSLGVSHPRHHSPSRASLAVTTVLILLLLVFILTGQDPFAVLYMWMVGLGTLGLLFLQTAGAVAVVAYLRRHAKQENVWTRIIAPTLGGLLLLIAVILAVTNFDQLIESEGAVSAILPSLYIAAVAIGLILGAVRKPADLRREFLPEENSTTEKSVSETAGS